MEGVVCAAGPATMAGAGSMLGGIDEAFNDIPGSCCRRHDVRRAARRREGRDGRRNGRGSRLYNLRVGSQGMGVGKDACGGHEKAQYLVL